MLKNVVFDIGNVLIKYKPVEFLSIKHSDSLTVGNIFRWVYQGPEWVELDRGTMVLSQAADSICEKSGLPRKWVLDALCNWMVYAEEMPENTGLISRLAADGMKIYYLSNFHNAASGYIFEKFTFFRQFTGGVFSCDVKLLKPEPAIYSSLTKKYGLNPTETVFIDDTKENVHAAQELGWKGIHYEQGVSLEEELRQLMQLSK